MTNKTINRWAVLIASAVVLLCTGAIYAFSVLAGPLSVEKGWSMESIMTAFAINSAIGPIPMILGGFLTDKGLAKWSIVLGGVLFAVGFFFIKTAPKDYAPAGWSPAEQAGAPKMVNKNWQQMLATPAFYLIFFMLFTGAFAGLMIASNASTIGQRMFGLTAATAAGYVSLYSLSNTLGRMLWGTISDKIGRNKTLYIIMIVVIAAFALILGMNSQIGFAIGIIALGLTFGGVMGVFPPMVMENFGPINQGVNYGITFVGYSVAAFFAPKVAVGMAGQSGDFSKAFYVAIVIALVGIVLNFAYIQLKKRAN